MSDRIVITGLGIVSPIGVGIDAYWRSLMTQQSGIRSLIERTDEGAKPDGRDDGLQGLWIGGAVIDFDAKVYVRPRKSLKVMCREIQTAFAASQMALDQAKFDEWFPARDDGPIHPSRVGVVYGSEMFYGPPSEMMEAIRGSLTEDNTGDIVKFGESAMRDIMPLWMLKYLPNMPACHFGIALNALGPNNTLVLGEVSAAAALIEAASTIERGIADVVFSGSSGTTINTTRMNYRGHMNIPHINGSITSASQPHHASSKGVVAGEGAAAVALESEGAAIRRGQPILARLVSSSATFIPSKRIRSGLASDSLGSADAIEQAIRMAIEKADIRPDAIGMVVSQGLGQPELDEAERNGINRSGITAPWVAPVASTGHTGAAIGGIGIVTGVLTLMHGTIPPTLGATSATRDSRLIPSPESLRGDYVLCLSHTCEGNATAILLEKNQ